MMQKKGIHRLKFLLLPIALLYRCVVGLRNLLFDWGILSSEEFRLPVISVGNITVGGTGKTPHTEYLVDLLQETYEVAMLSRGYKRKTRNFTIAGESSTVDEIGDEPRQVKNKFPRIRVAVDRKRVNGIRQLCKLAPPVEVVILDDAFQHRYVKPGKSILLIDYNRMITEDFLLPAGRLREPASARKRADIILITKSPGSLKPIEMRNIVNKLHLDLHQHLFFTCMEYGTIQPVFPESVSSAEHTPDATSMVILSGIANPAPFIEYASTLNEKVQVISFPDHHRYTEKDIIQLEKILDKTGRDTSMVLTTEKDAVRLQSMPLNNSLKKVLYFVPIKVIFLNDDRDEFNQIILNYVRSNQRNNILHKETNHAAS